MKFNPDTNNKANDFIFLGSLNNCSYPSLKFNRNKISKCPQQKHLGVVLDSKLYFNIYTGQKNCYTVCLTRKAYNV